MSDKIPHNRKAVLFNIRLYGGGYVTDTVAVHGKFYPQRSSVLLLNQAFRLIIGIADNKCCGAVTVIDFLIKCADIHTHYVHRYLSTRSSERNAISPSLTLMQAEAAKTVKTEEGRLCAVGDNEFLDLTVNELSCDTFANMFFGRQAVLQVPLSVRHHAFSEFLYQFLSIIITESDY